MKSIRKIAVLMAAVILLVSAAGCGVLQKNPEKDKQQVVAEVNGQKILKDEFLELYRRYVTEEDEKDETLKDQIKAFKTQILDQLVTQKVIEEKAKLAGFTMKDEYRDEAKKMIDDFLVSMEENLKLQGQGAEGEDTDYAKMAKENLNAQLESIGMTEEQFIEETAKGVMIEKFMDETLKDVQATQDEIQKYYDDTLKAQKENPAGITPNDIQLYKPDRIRVKHILIALPDDQRTEYNQLVSEGKNDDAKKYLDDKLKGIQPKAQEVLDKAKGGEDFDALVEQYSEDPGMDKEEGYIMFKGSGMIKEFEDAALALKDGEISGLVGAQFGYHIIKRYESLPEEVISLDKVKDDIKASLDNEKKNTEYKSMVDQWTKDANIKKYENRL